MFIITLIPSSTCCSRRCDDNNDDNRTSGYVLLLCFLWRCIIWQYFVLQLPMDHTILLNLTVLFQLLHIRGF